MLIIINNNQGINKNARGVGEGFMTTLNPRIFTARNWNPEFRNLSSQLFLTKAIKIVQRNEKSFMPQTDCHFS